MSAEFLGAVSLTFRELSIMISRKNNARNHICGENFKLKLCMWLWAHYKVSAWNSYKKYDFCNTQISRISWRAHEMLVKQSPGDHYRKLWWAHNLKLGKMHVFTWKNMIRSGHNFAQYMTTKLSWHVQNCDQVDLLPTWINFNPNLDK